VGWYRPLIFEIYRLTLIEIIGARESISFRTDGHAQSPRDGLFSWRHIDSVDINRATSRGRPSVHRDVSFGGSAKIGLSNLAAGTVTVRVSIFVCNRSLPIPWAEELDRRAIIIYAQSHRPRIDAPRDSFISIIRVRLVSASSSPGPAAGEVFAILEERHIENIYLARREYEDDPSAIRGRIRCTLRGRGGMIARINSPIRERAVRILDWELA